MKNGSDRTPVGRKTVMFGMGLRSYLFYFMRILSEFFYWTRRRVYKVISKIEEQVIEKSQDSFINTKNVWKIDFESSDDTANREKRSKITVFHWCCVRMCPRTRALVSGFLRADVIPESRKVNAHSTMGDLINYRRHVLHSLVTSSLSMEAKPRISLRM